MSGLSEEQKKVRSKGVGGSDTPAILGVDPYRSPRDVALDKLGESPEREATGPMLRGITLEPIVAKMVGERTGIKFHKPKETVFHPRYNWLVASLDGLSSKGDLLEIKCPNVSTFLKCKREGLPLNYTAQVQHYMTFPKVRRCHFGVFSAERWELLIVEQDPDPEFQEIIIDKTGEFWRNLQDGILPPEDERPVIDLPRADNGEVLKIDSPEFINAVSELWEAQGILREAKEFEGAARAEILRFMGDSSIIEAEGIFRAYYREQAGRRSFDDKAFAKAHPEIDLSRFYKVGKPFRSFKPYFLDGRKEA